MAKTINFFISLFKISLKSSISKRGVFLIESGLMFLNNLIFFIIWWIFFQRFEEIGGWHFQDMILLIAIGTASYGLMQICFGGVREIAKIIISGDLDPFMTQPKNLLLHIAGSKSNSKGWGHLINTLVLLIMSGPYSIPTLLLIAICIVTGCLVFTSINIIGHSFPFWLGSVESVSKKYCDSLFLFALYPTNIYSGFLQIIMFTIIPAGIIGYLPIELIHNFSLLNFLVLIASALSFFALSFFIFFLGLKRYESGNKFMTRI